MVAIPQTFAPTVGNLARLSKNRHCTHNQVLSEIALPRAIIHRDLSADRPVA